MWPDVSSPGYGIFVRNVVHGLADNGYLIVRKALIVGRPNGWKSKLKRYISFYWQIVRSFMAGGYDLIYIHFPNHAVPVLSGLYRFRKPKMVVNYHGEDLLYEKGGYKERLGKKTDHFLHKFASRIVVPSSYFKEIVVERGTISEERIIVSPSGGISEDIFFPKSDLEIDVPERFTPERPLRIGYVGRLEDEKGIIDFMHAFLDLRKKHLAIEATIIGYGTLESYILDFIHLNKLEGAVKYLGGVTQSELGQCYRDMDLFVFPSHAPESLGLTGIEALACGIPVVASNIGGITTYLIDGVNGLLVTPGEVSQLSFRIAEFSQLPAMQRKEMREHCIASGRTFYSKKVCKDLSSSFDKVLKEQTK